MQRSAVGQCCEQLFDQGNFEAMKMLSDWEAARCDEHQFRAKSKVSILEPFWSYRCLKSGLNKERKKERKKLAIIKLLSMYYSNILMP